MSKHIKIIRPVGNKINTIQSLVPPSFSSFSVQFYNSGTESLAAAIIAARKIKNSINKPEVIVPAYACPDLISAILFANAIPVLVDIDIDSPLISLEKLNDAINDQTIVIISIRFFGIEENNKELSNLAKQHDLIFIEDSAQGFPNKDIESYWGGDFIIVSFGRGKPLNLLKGGAVLTRDSRLIENLPSPLPTSDSFIGRLKYKLKLYIYNQSINPFAYGLITLLPGLKIGQTIYKPLAKLCSINEHAKKLLNSNMDTYPTRLNCQKAYAKILKNCNKSQLIDLPRKLEHDLSQPLLRYPILVKNFSVRNRLYEKLKPYGASLMYKKPLHKIDKVNALIKQLNNEYPNATNFAHQLITLPTHEDVDKKTLHSIQRILYEI